MEKIKFRISSWDKGREFMKEMGIAFQIAIEERDINLVGENSSFSLTCLFDDRGFSVIEIKLQDPELKDKIEQVKQKYV